MAIGPKIFGGKIGQGHFQFLFQGILEVIAEKLDLFKRKSSEKRFFLFGNIFHIGHKSRDTRKQKKKDLWFVFMHGENPGQFYTPLWSILETVTEKLEDLFSGKLSEEHFFVGKYFLDWP